MHVNVLIRVCVCVVGVYLSVYMCKYATTCVDCVVDVNEMPPLKQAHSAKKPLLTIKIKLGTNKKE